MRTVVGTAALAIALGLAAVNPAAAGDAKLDTLQVKGAWARATPPGAKTGGAFLTLVNTTAEDGTGDSLVGASTPVARAAELHMHVQDGDIMRMVALNSIDIRPAQTLKFAPGGLHVMLMDLKQPLKQGGSFPLTLTFKRSGQVTVAVDVQAVGAAAGPAEHMDHSSMPPDEYRKMHEQHMKDPEHRAMHEQMHGKGN